MKALFVENRELEVNGLELQLKKENEDHSGFGVISHYHQYRCLTEKGIYYAIDDNFLSCFLNASEIKTKYYLDSFIAQMSKVISDKSSGYEIT